MASIDATTTMLRRIGRGDTSAEAELLPLVYDELRGLARAMFANAPPAQTLQPTALVHEAFLRLIRQDGAEWTDRAHFFRVAAKAMRQILIDHARARMTAKRGGQWQRVTLALPGSSGDRPPLDVLALNEALDDLAARDPRQAHVVELRFFAGMTTEESAQALGVSRRTIELDWNMAKAWLLRALAEDDPK